MQKKLSNRKNEISLPVKNILSFFLSTLFGTISSLLVSFIFSFILSNSAEISDYTFVYLIFSFIIGGFVCGFSGSSMLQFKGLVSGLMCCVPYTIVMYILMFIFSNGKLNASSLLSVLVIVISSSIGGMTNANIKRRK
ncbi:MAG: TIGR04086 family membrane protein [Clostridia bacterium]|nr:TIGR04086 family membrane protein [Clostridia bacterium]